MPTPLGPKDRSIFGDSKVPSKFSGDHWIAGATKHKGALHRNLGVPEGQKIPDAKIKSAEHSGSPKIRKEANLAETLKHMHKK
jgi:hypothetical protein